MNVPIPTDYDPESPNQTVYDLPRGTGYTMSRQIVPDTGYGPVNIPGPWRRVVTTPQPEPGPFDQIGKLAEQAYATMPAQEAEAAVASAIQFQGLRGYNRDMQSGKSANEAIAKWGPAMFYRSPQTLAQVMKANQAPAMTPYQQANLDLARRRLELATQDNDVMPKPFERDPNKPYITRGGAFIPPVKPDATEVQTVTETIPEQAPVPAVPPKARPTIFGVPIPFTKATEAQPAIPGHGEMKVKRIVPAGQPLSQTAAASAPDQAKPLDKATASLLLKQAGGDKAKARELAKKAGYTF